MPANGLLVADLLEALSFPGLIVDEGIITYSNAEAVSVFGPACTVGTDIRDYWPDYSLRRVTAVEKLMVPGVDGCHCGVASTTAVGDGSSVLVLFRLNGSQPMMLEPVEGYGSTAWLQTRLDSLVDLMHRVSSKESLTDICRETVSFALEELDIDRIAILMIDYESNMIRGTWGTDADGNLKDESDYESDIRENHWVEDALASTTHSAFHDSFDLRNYDEVVGHGWNAMVNLWRGNQVIGWLAADNLLKHRPLTPSMKSLLRQLGGFLSQMIVFKENEWSAAGYREELERIVAEKTDELNRQHRKFMVVNRKLRDREAMENMGEAIAGVAHELNNPIGTGITAASGISGQTDVTRKAFDAHELSEEDFAGYMEYVDEASRILELNLKRAADLVNAFRKTAVDQASDRPMDINLKQFVDTIVLSQGHLLKRQGVRVDVDIPDGLVIRGYPGLLTQVLINLVTNSLKHGFSGHSSDDRISLSIEKAGEGIIVRYRDNGRGISPEAIGHLFESFYTTARDDGGSGLGLYIVRDIIENSFNGSITALSEPGEYTEFEISLPGSSTET